MIQIPEDFAAYTVMRAGDAGRQWIERVPELVETCCQQWSLVIDGAPMHGGLSIVVPVRQGAERCVLKVGWEDDSTVYEALALLAWNGEGTVRLFAAHPEWNVLLLERLDSRRSLNDVGLEEAIAVAGHLLRRLAILPPAGLPSLRSVAARLAETFPRRWERYGRPLPRQRLERARDLALQFGPSSGGLLVNYDLIYADVLAGEREPWLVVDPKVVVGDPEYGVAQLLWRRLEEIHIEGGLERHFEALIEAASLDAELARSWTFVRCVDYWLWGVSIGLTEDPARCEAILNWLS